jgi:hypothetical protein
LILESRNPASESKGEDFSAQNDILYKNLKKVLDNNTVLKYLPAHTDEDYSIVVLFSAPTSSV